MHRNLPAAVTSGFVLVLLIGIFGLNSSIADEHPNNSATEPRTATVPDTVVASTPQDTPLILSLPATVQDRPVTRYKILRGPSLCGVAGQSFTWVPHAAQNPPYHATLEAVHPDPPTDTLVVQMDIES